MQRCGAIRRKERAAIPQSRLPVTFDLNGDSESSVDEGGSETELYGSDSAGDGAETLSEHSDLAGSPREHAEPADRPSSFDEPSSVAAGDRPDCRATGDEPDR